MITKLRLNTRATEFAFAKDTSRMPSWIEGAKVEEYKAKGKRISWKRLVLFQPEDRNSDGTFKQGVALRWREYTKHQTVDANYKFASM